MTKNETMKMPWIEQSTNQPWEMNSPAPTTSHDVRRLWGKSCHVRLPCFPFQGLLWKKQKRNDDNYNNNDNKPLVSFWFSHSINNFMYSLSDKSRRRGLGAIRCIRLWSFQFIWTFQFQQKHNIRFTICDQTLQYYNTDTWIGTVVGGHQWRNVFSKPWLL